MKRAMLCAAILLGVAAPTAHAAVLVRFESGTSAAERAAALHDAGVRREHGVAVPGLEVVSGGAAAAAALGRAPGVRYAEPDQPRRATRLAGGDTFPVAQWGLERIGAPTAWTTTTGTRQVTVAIADTGADLDHPDLRANLVAGWDFVSEDPLPDDEDPEGHGTHVAGIAGARGDDGFGVAGVAWNARLMPLRVLRADGSGRVSDVIRAYQHAAAGGARIVNLSLGGSNPSRAERDALAAAPDVLFVAAAGNDAADVDTTPTYPCAYELPNVICVTATDQADGRPAFANVGAATVDVAAPGVNILGAVPDDAWALLSGTSMAAPHVAGAAALLLAREPAARPSDIIAAIVSTSVPVPAFAGLTVSGGRLDVAAALLAVRATASPSPAPAPAPPPTPPAAPEPPRAPLPAGPSPPAPRQPAKLKLRRAGVHGGRLDVLARITRDATGNVDVAYRAGGRTLRFRAPVEHGRIRFARRLPRRQRASGILTLRWRGNARVHEAGLRVRAAAQPARLRWDAATLRDGQLRVQGRISRRARGHVRIEFALPDGTTRRFQARITRGRWSLSTPVAAPSGYLSIQFTGLRRARGGPMRGEQDGTALG